MPQDNLARQFHCSSAALAGARSIYMHTHQTTTMCTSPVWHRLRGRRTLAAAETVRDLRHRGAQPQCRAKQDAHFTDYSDHCYEKTCPHHDQDIAKRLDRSTTVTLPFVVVILRVQQHCLSATLQSYRTMLAYDCTCALVNHVLYLAPPC